MFFDFSKENTNNLKMLLEQVFHFEEVNEKSQTLFYTDDLMRLMSDEIVPSGNIPRFIKKKFATLFNHIHNAPIHIHYPVTLDFAITKQKEKVS